MKKKRNNHGTQGLQKDTGKRGTGEFRNDDGTLIGNLGEWRGEGEGGVMEIVVILLGEESILWPGDGDGKILAGCKCNQHSNFDFDSNYF